jgi:hypothetical protein
MQEPERGARLFGAASAFLDVIGAPSAPADRAEWERDEHTASAQIGDDAYAQARAAEQGLALEGVVAEKLGEVRMASGSKSGD